MPFDRGSISSLDPEYGRFTKFFASPNVLVALAGGTDCAGMSQERIPRKRAIGSPVSAGIGRFWRHHNSSYHSPQF
jgi:hypothetical protein